VSAPVIIPPTRPTPTAPEPTRPSPIPLQQQSVEQIVNNYKKQFSSLTQTQEVKVFNQEKVSKPALVDYTEQLKELAQDYPTKIDTINLNFSRAGTLGNVQRKAFTGKVESLNVLVLSETEMRLRLRKAKIEKERLDNFLTVVDDKNANKYLVTHEFAHTLYNFKEAKDMKKRKINNPYEDFGKAVIKIEKEYYKETQKLKELRFEAEQKFFDGKIPKQESGFYEWKSPDAKKYQEQLKEIQISTYAEANTDEFFAESFSQAKLAEKPSRFSMMVLELVDKTFKVG